MSRAIFDASVSTCWLDFASFDVSKVLEAEVLASWALVRAVWALERVCRALERLISAFFKARRSFLSVLMSFLRVEMLFSTSVMALERAGVLRGSFAFEI